MALAPIFRVPHTISPAKYFAPFANKIGSLADLFGIKHMAYSPVSICIHQFLGCSYKGKLVYLSLSLSFCNFEMCIIHCLVCILMNKQELRLT